MRQNLSKHLKARQIEYVNRVRDKDVPYMTPEWKSAIRAKRKANAKYLKNKTQETWELRRKTRNEATKQRRIAIKNYWKIKAADLKSNPRDFFKTFKPFLSTKDCSTSTDIQLKVEGTIVKDQRQVSEILVDYFSTIADGIGGDIFSIHLYVTVSGQEIGSMESGLQFTKRMINTPGKTTAL